MLKKRIIGAVISKNGIAVQSFNFKKYLPIGGVGVALEYLDNWGIDEIILVDIDATRKGKTDVLNNLKSYVKNCFVPLTYGGGLHNMSDVHLAFNNGADKVSFNQAFIHKPDIVEQTAAQFGTQGVVASIDFIENEDRLVLYDYVAQKPMKVDIISAVKKAQNLGAGEVLLNAVDRDGRYSGFAVDALKELEGLSIPIILMGGGRTASHFHEAFSNTNVSGLGAANMFHFVEHSVAKLRSQIRELEIRPNPFFNYDIHHFTEDQRLEKLPDHVLSDLLYQKLNDQKI